jgi:hypothetical protein
MRRFNILSMLALGVLAISAQGVMAAEPVLTFGFSDLVGDFTVGERGASMLFTAANDETTNGDVTRIPPPAGTVEFAGNAFDYFSLSIEITPVDEDNNGIPDIPVSLAVAGVGTLMMTDFDGDMIVGTVEGLWINNGSANFVGNASNVTIGTDDFEFNNDVGEFISLQGLGGTFDGNVLTLAFGNWFTDPGGIFQEFSGASTLAQGALVPEPATLCLVTLGALSLVIRRRRR